MPPKPKFTREEVIQAALQLVSRKGMDGLTARELGESLGSSARPIFTLFKNMEELQTEVRAAAMRRFETYGNQISGDMPLFKQIGMRVVLFGMEEPKLYRVRVELIENGAETDADETRIGFRTIAADPERCRYLVGGGWPQDSKRGAVIIAAPVAGVALGDIIPEQQTGGTEHLPELR